VTHYIRANVLDKGFIELLDVMGDDRAIVEAARTSTGNCAHDDDEKNAKLINYLMEHNHSSPFEMGEMKFRVKMPIFVMRQWVR
jgi:thymidylate synthase (FAD)